MKHLSVLFLAVVITLSCKESNNLSDSGQFVALNHPVQLEQNDYILKNKFPISILGSDNFVKDNSFSKIEETFQKQINEFSETQSSGDSESIKRNVFINHFSKLVLQKYLRFDNDAQKEKCIYYCLSYLKTGPTDLKLGQEVLEFLKSNQVLSKSSEAEIVYVLSKSSEHRVKMLEKEISDLRTALKESKDKQMDKAMLLLLSSAEKRLQDAINIQKTFISLPQKPVDLQDRKFIVEQFLQFDLEKHGVKVSEML